MFWRASGIQFVASSGFFIFSGHELSLLLLREACHKLTLWNDLSWALALARNDVLAMSLPRHKKKNKKIVPFAMQTSWDHVLKNKKKKEFGPMTCREFYLKFQYLIRLEDKGAPFGIQLVSHSLCMDPVTVGQAPCIIHFLFFQQVFTLSIFRISYLHLHLNTTRQW
jgi:hypothetical protein